MSEVEHKETKFEARLKELDAELALPAKKAALRVALVDLIEKAKAIEDSAEVDKAETEAAELAVKEAEKVVEAAEADISGKKPEPTKAEVAEAKAEAKAEEAKKEEE